MRTTRRGWMAVLTVALLACASVAWVGAGDDMDTVVGTVISLDGDTLRLRTDSGEKILMVGSDVDRAILKVGDRVSVDTDEMDGEWTLTTVRLAPFGATARTYTATGSSGDATLERREVGLQEIVTVRDVATGEENPWIERLVVDNVDAGSLSELPRNEEINATVMLAGANQIKIRTTEGNFEGVVFQAHKEGGNTDFQTGQHVVITRGSLPGETTSGSAMLRGTEPMGSERAPTAPVYGRTNTTAATGTTTTGSSTSSSYARRDVDADTDTGYRDTTMDHPSELPQTASHVNLAAVIGLLALVGALAVGVTRKLMF